MIWINNSFLEYLTLVGFHVKGPDCLVLRSIHIQLRESADRKGKV